jgi:hypothetical protein
VSIVDELLDELTGAQWFTKLDFRSGYHKIRVVDGDELKTAFQKEAFHQKGNAAARYHHGSVELSFIAMHLGG